MKQAKVRIPSTKRNELLSRTKRNPSTAQSCPSAPPPDCEGLGHTSSPFPIIPPKRMSSSTPSTPVLKVRRTIIAPPLSEEKSGNRGQYDVISGDEGDGLVDSSFGARWGAPTDTGPRPIAMIGGSGWVEGAYIGMAGSDEVRIEPEISTAPERTVREYTP